MPKSTKLYKVPDELRQQHDETNIRIRELESEIENSPVRDLVRLVRKHGNYRGEVKDMTKREYREIFHSEPREVIVNKKSKIPWHLALDQITSERGYRTDEELKESIERLYGQMQELKALRAGKRGIKSDIVAASKTPPKKEIIIVNANPPVFPKDETTRAIVTQVDGLTMEAARNPSFYQIKDNKPETPDVRVRYSKDARRLMNLATADYIRSMERPRRLSGRAPRISPRMPRLR